MRVGQTGKVTDVLRLSTFAHCYRVERDAQFSTLGYVDSGLLGTLVYADTPVHLRRAAGNSAVSAVVVTSELACEVPHTLGFAVAEHPRDAFYAVHEEMVERALYPRSSLIPRRAASSELHASVSAGQRTCIGAHVRVAEHAVIRDNVRIEDDCSLDVGVVVGCDGILYAEIGGARRLVRHAGGVVIARGTALLAYAVVARGVHPGCDTRIGEESIIGIGATVGHEATIGNRCVISGRCVVARRAVLGDDVWLGTGSFVREHVKVGARARIMAGSVVVSDVPAGAEVSGNFAVDHSHRLHEYAVARRAGSYGRNKGS